MSQLVCSCGQQHGRVRSRLWTPARSCIMGSLSCRDHHQRHHHHHRGSCRGQCSEWGDVYRTEDQLLRWLHRWRVVLLQPKILLHLLHWIHLQRLLLLLKLNWFELPFQNIAKLSVVDILRLITLSIFDNFFKLKLSTVFNRTRKTAVFISAKVYATVLIFAARLQPSQSANAPYAVVWCLSVVLRCLSVTFLYCVETSRRIVRLFHHLVDPPV